MFFSFDGLDGVGKSTQMDLFVEWLRAAGHDVVQCRDPGSTPLGEAIREILLGHEFAISRTSEMLLFMAARAQLVEEVIRPALAVGQDRGLRPLPAGQRGLSGTRRRTGRGGHLARRPAWPRRGLMPEMVFLLDMPPRAASGRIDRQLDRMENQGAEFQARLRTGLSGGGRRRPGAHRGRRRRAADRGRAAQTFAPRPTAC